MSRSAVVGALGSICSVILWGCSIDFVALPITTRIHVRSEHVEDLRVTVEIQHTGPEEATVRIAGEPIGLDGLYSVHFETSVDPLAPVVHIEVEQLPGALLDVQAPLLVRTGEATCEADGDVLLPARLDSMEEDGLSRTWTVVLLDGEDEITALARSEGSMPDPLVVPRALMSERVRTARISVRAVGSAENAPYDANLDLWTEAEWMISNPCP